jgi:hypothetical protein
MTGAVQLMTCQIFLKTINHKVLGNEKQLKGKKKIKQSRYRPGVANRVPAS